MSKLYQIQAQIQQILDTGIAVDEETGEVLADASQLEALKMEESEKLENMVCYLKNLIADATVIKAEEQALKKRREVIDARASRLRDYIADRMKVAGMAKFEAPRCVVSFRKSTQVQINDEIFFASDPDEEFYHTKYEPDKVSIKNALKSGKLIAGAQIITNESMQVK